MSARNVKIRETITKLIDKQEKQIQIFNPDPLNYLITQQEDHHYRNQVSHDLHQITQLWNLELWRLITDMIFLSHSKALYSIQYQLGVSYDRRFLHLITNTHVAYQDMLFIAHTLQINILLYKPSYSPKPIYHYYNMFIHDLENTKRTFLIYSRPIDCLINSISMLENLETMKGFFDLKQCMIRIEDYDQPNDIAECFSPEVLENQVEWYDETARNFYKFQGRYPTFKIWILIWCLPSDPTEIQDWVKTDTIYLRDLVLLMVKVALSFSNVGVLIFKDDYYCIRNDKESRVLMMVELDKDTLKLKMPFPTLTKDSLSKYNRKSLRYLLDHYSDLVIH